MYMLLKIYILPSAGHGSSTLGLPVCLLGSGPASEASSEQQANTASQHGKQAQQASTATKHTKQAQQTTTSTTSSHIKHNKHI